MGIGRLGAFNKIFFIVIASFFIVNAILISVEEKSVISGVSDIGNKLIYSTQQLSESSNEIYDKGFVVDSSDGFLKIIMTYWNVISSFLGVLLWIRIFAWIINGTLHLPGFFNYFIGTGLFVLLQIVVLLIFVEGNRFEIAMTPIMSLWHFIRILPIIAKPFRDFANGLLN